LKEEHDPMTHSRELRLHSATTQRTPLVITVDGKPVQAFAGESVATVLLALGQRAFRHTDRNHEPRGIFCGMGICFDCLVTIDGVENVRACMTLVEEGMTIETGGHPRA
jgi:predicted molibdopterin-dependent oxidoreductase YjgC